MNKKYQIITIVSILFIVISIVSLRCFFSPYKFQINQDSNWSSGWSYQGEDISLNGQKLDIPKNTAYSFSKKLPDTHDTDAYLLFRGSLADVSVKLDQQIIYSSQRERLLWIDSPPASLWHMVPISSDYAGSLITITLQSPYQTMNGLMNPVYLGSYGDLLFEIIHQFGIAFAVDILIFIFGVFLTIFAFVSPNREVNHSTWYVGMFSILAATWLIAESKMLQFFVGHQWFHASLAYLALTVIPIPLLCYIQSITRKKNRILLTRLMKLNVIALFTIVFLQLSNVCDFYESLPISHGLILSEILIISVLLMKDLKNKKMRASKSFILSLLLLFFFIVVEILQFFILHVLDVTLFVRIGLLGFIIILSFESLRQLLLQIEKSCHATFFERLAYKDPLTSGNNRLAFDKHMESLFLNRERLNGLRLVMLDMNNLKDTNDIYGHVTGDESIKAAYNIIDQSFAPEGITYRIGGDEFAVVIEKSNEHGLHARYTELYHGIREHDRIVEYPFGIAFGSVLYDPFIDETAKKMLHRADNNMYYNKKLRSKPEDVL
ncbi:MAG: diguanylate cyclase [Clostridia bacterium]|nr:diguanylate cyclase [Clostridia bacterium]